MKESSFEEDYRSTITFDGQREGRRVVEVTSLPEPDAVVVWGKVVTEIERERLIPLEAVYYDEDGNEARTMVFSEPRRFGERVLPARLELRPVDKPQESTVVVYEDIEFNVSLPEGMFSLRQLRRR